MSYETALSDNHSTYASVAILTLHPSCSTRMEAQASRVAPVVRISSTSRILLPGWGSIRLLGLGSKASFTLCHLSKRSFAVWVLVNDFLRRRWGRISGFLQFLSFPAEMAHNPFCIPRCYDVPEGADVADSTNLLNRPQQPLPGGV